MKNYIDSQQHWEDSINADFDYREGRNREQIDDREQLDDRAPQQRQNSMNREDRIKQAEKDFIKRMEERASLKKISPLDNIEKQVIRCVMAGLKSKEIAELLRVKYNTVTYARYMIHRKLDTRTVAEVLYLADKLKLL
jgi:FixJ family two-component response regulator